jgi:adenine-specific DNA-methyltransferase
VHISYMGTKKKLAPDIAKLVNEQETGPFLDLFSGMCSVGQEVALSSRPVWSNDVQFFSHIVAKSLFTSQEIPAISWDELSKIKNLFHDNYQKLEQFIFDELEYEKQLYTKHNAENLIIFEESIRKKIFQNSQIECFSHHLFTSFYACTYIGLTQALEVDSLRYAFDTLKKDNSISNEKYEWFLISLGQALSKSSTSTGHFAQYLTLKNSNYKKFILQRQKSLWQEWVMAIESLTPINSKQWRSNNVTFRQDANELLKTLKSSLIKPSVIYADPPYTADQYSRYYHLYETLILYDYPDLSAKARYRSDRFQSPFSLKSQVDNAMETLIAQTAALGSTFILSYPENGLIPNARSNILTLLQKHFRIAKVAIEVPHKHSSFGASKGQQSYDVNELIFYAR